VLNTPDWKEACPPDPKRVNDGFCTEVLGCPNNPPPVAGWEKIKK